MNMTEKPAIIPYYNGLIFIYFRRKWEINTEPSNLSICLVRLDLFEQVKNTTGLNLLWFIYSLMKWTQVFFSKTIFFRREEPVNKDSGMEGKPCQQAGQSSPSAAQHENINREFDIVEVINRSVRSVLDGAMNAK